MAHSLVVAPEQIVQTGATYLFGISAVAASAFVGIKILLWDYRVYIQIQILIPAFSIPQA